MDLFRCRICGEVYFGKHPSHCPYCGAHEEYLIPITDWKDENKGFELTKKERAQLKETIDLEYTNTRFYRAAARATKNGELAGYFKYLVKIENEHYNAASKLLSAEKNSTIFDPSEERGSDLANLKYSKEKEEHASKLYAEFIPQSKNERLKTFFSALSAVEADHINLDDLEIEKLSKERG